MDNAHSMASSEKITTLIPIESHQKTSDGFNSSQFEGYSKIKDPSVFKFDGSVEHTGLSPDLKSLFHAQDATPDEINKASTKLDSEISPMTPPDVVKDLKDIHSGVLKGDTKEVGQAFQDIESKHPELMPNVVQELNRELKDTNAGVEFGVTAENKILLYKNDPLDTTQNNSALQFDPADGSAVVRPVQVREDGSVLIQPGELVNADPDAIAKGIGNGAVSGINGGFQESGELFSKSLGQKFSDPGMNKFLERLQTENPPELTRVEPLRDPLRRFVDPPMHFKFRPDSAVPIGTPEQLREYLKTSPKYEVMDKAL